MIINNNIVRKCEQNLEGFHFNSKLFVEDPRDGMFRDLGTGMKPTAEEWAALSEFLGLKPINFSEPK